MRVRSDLLMGGVGLGLGLSSVALGAFTIAFDSGDFITTPVFSEVEDFYVEIVVDDVLEAGRVYDNPSLVSVRYGVSGTLELGTPSGFFGV
ncbi:MAG: hypothetical protein RIG82_01665 [Phycisphaeraceae bacterium]